MKRANKLPTKVAVTARCMEPTSHATHKWTLGMLEWQPNRVNERQRADPGRCSMDAKYEVHGMNLCTRHAGAVSLNILLNEELP